MSALRELGSHVTANSSRNSEIGPRQAVDHKSRILSRSTISLELHAKMVEEIDVAKCNFLKFRRSVTLTLTLDQVNVISVCATHNTVPACPTM